MASLSKSDPRMMKRCAMIAVLVASAGLAGCAEYLGNQDRVATRAGNASEANTAIQTIQPWPPEAYNTDIELGG